MYNRNPRKAVSFGMEQSKKESILSEEEEENGAPSEEEGVDGIFD